MIVPTYLPIPANTGTQKFAFSARRAAPRPALGDATA